MDLSFTSRYDDWSILLSVHIYIVLFYLMNNYFNRLECRIRLKSIKHFTSFSFKLAALSTGIWTTTLFLLIFLIAFSNGFSFSLEIKEVDFLREFYGISIANNASFFIGVFSLI